MKSNEGKVKSRPPIRKQKNSSASENENNRSILDFFSPPRTTNSNLNNNNHEKSSGSTPKRRKNPLENLQSNLSPKYIGFSTPTSADKRRSRYRTTKLNDSDSSSSFFQSSERLIGCVRRTTMNGRISSPKSSPEVSLRRNKLFESPIERLLRKNGAMKSLPNSPSHDIAQLSATDVMDVERSDDVQGKKKNCVVRLEQMNHELVTLNSSFVGGSNKDIEPEFDASKTEHENFPVVIDDDEPDEVLQVITIVNDEDMPTSKKLEEENIKATSAPLEKEVAVSSDNSEPILETMVVPVEADSKTLVIDSEDIEMKEAPSNEEKAEVATPKVEEEPQTDKVQVTANAELEKDFEVIELEPSVKDEQEVVDNSALKVDEVTITEKESVPIEDHQKEELQSLPPEDDLPAENKSQSLNLPDEITKNIKLMEDASDQPNIAEDLHDHNEQLMNSKSKFCSEDLLSLKSPSTYSVDSAKGSSLDNDMNWMSIETGDLFWGQIFSYAYWPCMVCPDPEGQTITFDESGGESQDVMIHVRFFADNGRRSWVKRDNLMTYNGLDVFLKKQEEVSQKYGKKSSKYRLFVVNKKAKVWNKAIKEADLIETIPMEERLDKFFQLLKEEKISSALERKRRQSALQSSTSDLCSMFDSNDNLYLKQVSLKRDRSPTPISPAYSPLGPKNSEKRIKLHTRRSSLMDELNINTDSHRSESTASSEIERMQGENIYNDIEFKKFVSAMRSFILENSQDPALNSEFMFNVRNMWALKHITMRNQLESSMHIQHNSIGIKRLSQRIRNISVQRSLPSTPVQTEHLLAIKPNEPKIKKPPPARPIEEVVDDIFKLDNKYLFREVLKEPLCKKCLKGGPNLVKCSMNCNQLIHPTCSSYYSNEMVSSLQAPPGVPAPFMHITADEDEPLLISEKKEMPPVICDECCSGEPSRCNVCKKNDPEQGDMARCSSHQCMKFYHPSCLKYWPQAKLTKSAGKLESLRCPSHVCHTCVSDDPKGKYLHIERSKLTKCIKCPATYHMDSTCIPAGSRFLTAAFIICPRHCKRTKDLFLNVNWCFICVGGGKLICCETCPTAVHAECLKIPVADEGYICEECETGRMPLYGEMVWAKFRNYRWWPSIILPPTEVPLNLVNKSHRPYEFVIRFFGSNDHGWISRKRVYLYQEGDSCEPPKSHSKDLDLNYVKGVEEAKRIAEIIKEKKSLMHSRNDKKQRLSPLPYVKIKVNRAVPPVKLNVDNDKISQCECDKYSVNPCGQDSGCLNRVLYNECNPKICPAGERCQNQLFEKRLYPKVEVLYMNEKGFGLICLEPISAGTFVIEYVGEVIDDAEFRRRITQKEQERDENFYFLTVEKDYIIDAGPKGNLARFMNHSCDPNCETQKWCVNGLNRVGLFAIKNIPKNTELTFNYFWDELLGNDKKSCHCGTAKCAGTIGAKFKEPKAKSSPPKAKSIKNRRMTIAKLKPPQKKQKPGPKEVKKPTVPPKKINTSNTTSSIADTTAEEDKAESKTRSSLTSNLVKRATQSDPTSESIATEPVSSST